ncbi:MAG: hypothetical protein GWP15_02015 [Nitrospirae bacterium]|nr:hypothetical protein [Nitrospirota bacterium]
MVHDKIQLAIQEVRKREEKLKGIKKDMKVEEKIEDEQYQDLKRGLKEMRLQVKDMEEDALEDLQKSEFYNELREMRLKAEEGLAQEREKLFKLLEEVPLKPFEIDVKEEEGLMKIQAAPSMRIFVNGKEIKNLG